MEAPEKALIIYWLVLNNYTSKSHISVDTVIS